MLRKVSTQLFSPQVDRVCDWPGLTVTEPGHFGGDAYTSGMIVDEREANGTGPLWKLLTRKQVWSGWGGPLFPNATTASDPAPFVGFDCGELGCLFDLKLEDSSPFTCPWQYIHPL